MRRETTVEPSQEIFDHLYQETFGAPIQDVIEIATDSVFSCLSDGKPRPVKEITNMVGAWTMGALIVARAMKAASDD